MELLKQRNPTVHTALAGQKCTSSPKRSHYSVKNMAKDTVFSNVFKRLTFCFFQLIISL